MRIQEKSRYGIVLLLLALSLFVTGSGPGSASGFGAEREGRLVREAEHYTKLVDGSWIVQARYPGFGGDGYMQDPNRLRATNVAWEKTKGLVYAMELKGGRYYLWLRRWAPKKWGLLGKSESNSAWVGLDGQPPRDVTNNQNVSSDEIRLFIHQSIRDVFDNQNQFYDEWTWIRGEVTFELSPGRHLLNLRAREGGYAVDRFLLTTDPGFVPSGVGPAETRE